MSKSAKKAKQPAADAMTSFLGDMAAVNPLTEAAMKTWIDMGTEAMRFASNRIQQDIETQKAMLACRTLADIQKVQADFYNNALEEYRAQAARMMEVLTNAAPGAKPGDLPSTRRKYNDIPL